MIANGKTGYFPYTPATNLLYGLREALKMLLEEEGLDEGVRAPRPPRRGHAPRGARLGPRDLLRSIRASTRARSPRC